MPINDIIFALDDCFFRPETRWSAFAVGLPMLGGSMLSKCKKINVCITSVKKQGV